jgi:hypothetical protein
VDVAVRLHELGLLPEKHRKDFVDTVTSYAVEGEDLYALESLEIQSVFTPAELSEFQARLRAELVPNLAVVRRNWECNFDSDLSPEGYMQPLLDSFSALKDEFPSESSILTAIDHEIQEIQIGL